MVNLIVDGRNLKSCLMGGGPSGKGRKHGQSLNLTSMLRTTTATTSKPISNFFHHIGRSTYRRACFSIPQRLYPVSHHKLFHFSAHQRICSTNVRQNELQTKPETRENIYTIPNILTTSRIISCPLLAWSILDGNYYLATGLLVYAGLTDLVRSLLRYSWVGVLNLTYRQTAILRDDSTCPLFWVQFSTQQPTRHL